ncbi:hypothetical protein [Adlercreutzia murintestinalis]|jgi:hypothetical protein|uniref:hypothetical protein n=1 Tax=Adlercreutzia murintestinalis TaxID=2941325 RepID=UPI00203FFC3C|nr:hypothetical protein [Adlercreutzia murintestinalis]
MNKVIIPTGYMGSGSSALTDLLSEFDGFEAPQGSFEYVFLHCPNGVFDLEDKLLVGNNALRSDEALRSFEMAMSELFDTPFWWVGDYRRNLSPRFMEITHAYIHKLTLVESESFWYPQERRGWGVFPRLAFNRILRTVTQGKIFPQKPLLYGRMRFSLPTPDAFYQASREYLADLFMEMGRDRTNLILDQLLLPFNAWRRERYFDGDAECFIVDRDPRDVFILNKYVWSKSNSQIPYPEKVDEFCEYYRCMRRSEKIVSDPHVHRMHFEDFVYDYDNTVQRIAHALGVSTRDHVNPLSGFDPKRSINNTQLFLLPQYRDEASVMAQELSEYLYEFPYERHPIGGDDIF